MDQNPWEIDWSKAPAQQPPIGYIPGPPKTPAAQTPAQATGDVLGNEYKGQMIGRVPLENAQTQTSIASGQNSIHNSNISTVQSVRDDFQKQPIVKDYMTLLPQYVSAIRAADNKAGDLQIVYAFAKAMDPGSVVREGETAMAASAGGVTDQVQGYLRSIDGSGRLDPTVRQHLISEMRNRASAVADGYNLARKQYLGIAQRSGLNPDDVVGPHPGLPYQQVEADFLHRPVRNQDGSLGPAPHGQAAPLPLDPKGEGDIGFNNHLEANSAPPGAQEFQQSLQQAIANGAVRTADDIVQYGQAHGGFNINAGQAKQAADAIAKGVMPDVRTPQFEITKITNERGKGGLKETLDAGVRGFADMPTLGFADEIAAAGDTLFSGGTMRYNLARQRAVDHYDEKNHTVARVGGQIAGAVAGERAGLMPMGEVNTARQFAVKGAGYGGGYGFFSGEGGVGDRALNALGGAAAGGTTSFALAKVAPAALNALAAGARRVIGPASARQNALLDAATAESVPVNASDVFPGTRNTVSTLETIPGSSGVVQDAVGAGRDAIEARVGSLGRGGTPRENMGEVVQNAGDRFIAKSGQQADRLYNRARSLAADTQVQPNQVVQVIDGLVAREAETPGGTRAGAIIRQYADAFKGGQPITIDGARRMRSELLARLRDDGGLTKDEATRVTGQIMDGVSQDIGASLAQAGKGPAADAYRAADRFYAQRMHEIGDVTERFLGTDASRKSPEQTLSVLNGMASPKGDSQRLAVMLRRMSPEERQDLAATISQRLGRRSEDEPFSPAQFIQNIRTISPAARRLVFGSDGEESIQNLVRLSNAKRETVASLNNSRSGQVSNYRNVISTLLFGLPGGGAMAAMGAGLNGTTGAVGGLAIGGGGLAVSRSIAKALMNEKFTRLLVQAPATANPAAIDAHIGKLRQLAATNPEIRGAVQSIEEGLVRAVNDNAGHLAAASDGKEKQRQKK